MTLAEYLTTGAGATLYADMIVARNDNGIAVALSAPSTQRAPTMRFVNARTVLAEAGMLGVAVLGKIEGFVRATLPEGTPAEAVGLQIAARYALRFVESAEGIDIGHPTTRAMLDALVPMGVLAQAEADAVKALGERTLTLGEVITGARVSVDDVSAVLNGVQT